MSTAAQKRLVFIRRYLWRVGFIALVTLIYSWIVTHATTTTYKAETVLAFKLTEMPVRFEFMKLLANPLAVFLEDDVYSVTYDLPSVLTSDTVANRVIDRGNLKERLYNPKEYPIYEDWYDDFKAHLMFDINPQLQSMTIAYAAETPELAKEITQLYSEEFEYVFAHLYWRYAVSDSIAKVVSRRREELARLDEMVNEYLTARGKIAVRRGASQDVMDYLYAEKASLLSTAEIRGYELAKVRIIRELKSAKKGEPSSPVTEALYEPVLIFAKSLYFQGNKRLAELESEYTGEHPEVAFWRQFLPIMEKVVDQYSIGAIRASINTLTMRSLRARASNELWTRRAAELKKKVEGLPGFEQDLYWIMRKQGFLEVALWFWERRYEFHTLGEELTDDPFIVLDEPVVPQKAYYPILHTWVYAFPVLLIVGTLWFLLRYKLEEETIYDIVNGRL